MASILRQIIAGPRLWYPEAGLDLCYVTDEIIATSGPSSTYPRRAYRNPTSSLVRFLDQKHGANWSIWEFRAEGTGYPDSEVYGRIHHFPFPDHHPPPFALIPRIMASMRNWLSKEGQGEGQGQGKGKVVVVHCKAGKGRSGTVACSFLISERGWKREDALRQYTERRMRVGFGEGVKIASQVRWVGYVDRWTNGLGKVYMERPVEVLEVHIWGLRDGVEVDVEGFVEEGRRIKCFHRFHRRERIVVGERGEEEDGNGRGKGDEGRDPSETEDLPAPLPSATTTPANSSTPATSPPPFQPVSTPKPWSKLVQSLASDSADVETAIPAVILRPKEKVILPSSDVNISIDRRAMSGYTGWTMITSVAHIWFNAYFEGGNTYDSGIFEAEWDEFDGIKGTRNKGIRALDRMKVVWRYAEPEPGKEGQAEGIMPSEGKLIPEPAPGEPVPEGQAADWRGRAQAGEEGIDPNVSNEERMGKPCSGSAGVELDAHEEIGKDVGSTSADGDQEGDVKLGIPKAGDAQTAKP